MVIVNDAVRKRWSAEFAELGIERVRSQVVLKRWPPEKITFAREWIHLQDVKTWQTKTPASAPGAKVGLARLRMNKKVWGAIAGIMFGGFALVRILARFKGGF
ncbi:MAG TPA: hypothetical protein VFB16_12330 [Bauldia sp.]|nr:hypothetical protein [Bauldia sp.]